MKNFEANKTYKSIDGRKFKCLDIDSDGNIAVAVFAPVKGCVIYKKDAFKRAIVINQTTKIQQATVDRDKFSSIWIRASSEV